MRLSRMLRLLVLAFAAVVTVLAANPLPTVHLKIAAGLNDKELADKITLLASTKTYVQQLSNTGDKCFKSLEKVEQNVGIVYLLESDSKCKPTTNSHRIIYNKKDGYFQLPMGNRINSTDVDGLGEPIATLIETLQKDASTEVVITKKTEDSGVSVPVWAIVIVGIVMGALLAGNCIFFGKLRGLAGTRRTHPADASKSTKSNKSSVKSTPSVKQIGKDIKRGGSSKRSKKSSSSKSTSSKKSSKKAKAQVECRSSKSLATKTCTNEPPISVKVVAVQPKKESTPASSALPRDEVSTVMRSTLPERSLERVRAPPAASAAHAAKPPCCSQPARSTVISTQPRPSVPIQPTVSFIGHSSPFQVLASATSPLPPASTPAIMSGLDCKYTNATVPTGLTAVPQYSVAPAAYTVPSTTSIATVSTPTTPHTATTPVSVGSTPLPVTLPPPVVFPSMTTVPLPIVPFSTVPLSTVTSTASVVVPTAVTVVPTTATVSTPATTVASSTTTAVPTVVATVSAPPPSAPTVPPVATSPFSLAKSPTVPPPAVPMTVAWPSTVPPASPALSVASTPSTPSSAASSRERSPSSKRAFRRTPFK